MATSPGMTSPFSHSDAFIAKLKSIEQQINQNQLQEAAGELTLLNKTYPRDPRLFLLGSRLAEASQNPDGMLMAARKARELAPEWPVATMHLASVLTSKDHVNEALELAEMALVQAKTQGAEDIELLAKAASLAQRLYRYEKALEWLRRAEKISPDDLIIRHQIGRTLANSGDHAAAINIYTSMLEHLPNQPTLLLDRLRAHVAADQLTLAVADAEALTAIDPNSEVIQFYSAIARGETPKSQPVSVIKGMFDGYADHFDRHLVLLLQYRLPKDVANLILQWHPDRNGDVLDLGCGTGLLGANLGAIAGVLVGVDLSTAMIEQATRHQVYDKFYNVNVLDALQATPDNQYHVIAALDVLIYVGNLDSVVPNALRILLPGGRFVFSCEVADNDEADYALQKSYRYTHRRGYVQHLLEVAGFESIDFEDRVIRLEVGSPVRGFLVTARKPAHQKQKTSLPLPKNAKQARLRQ